MSSLQGPFNTTAASIQGGYGLYNQLNRSLRGDQAKMSFVVGNKAVVQFDCCLSESHVYAAQPTAFPLENGSTVSDHVMTAPIALQVVAAIADHPPETQQQLIDTGVSAAVSAATAPLGAVGTAAGTIGFTTIASAYNAQSAEDQAKSLGSRAKTVSLSRSAAMYSTLRRLAGYAQVDDGTQQKKGRAARFDVVTAKLGKKWCRFPNMILQQLSVERDNSTGARTLVFSMQLVEMRIAYADTSTVYVAQPEKHQVKSRMGEGAAEESDEPTTKQRYDANTYGLKGGIDAINEALNGR